MKNKKTYLVIGLLIIILVICVYYVADLKDKNSNTIKIGGLFALTGKWQTGGETEANFAKIAIDEINNNGGILGKKIEFVLEDDKCSGKDALSAAQKLVEKDEVNIILGPSCTPASQSVAPYLNSKDKLLIAFSTTAAGIFNNFPYAFRTSPPATDASKLIAEIAINKYKKNKVAIITEQTDFAKTWSDGFAKTFTEKGGEIVFTEDYITGVNDFRSIISKLANKKPDIIFISSQAPQDSGLFVKQISEMGYLDDFQISGNPTLIDSKTRDVFGNIPSNYFSVAPYSENDVLLKKYREKYKQEPGFQFFYAASAYDMVYVLKDAIEHCRSANSKCVKKYLDDLNNHEGVVAKWSFNEFGDAVLPVESYKEIRFSGDKIIYDNIIR